MTSYRSNCGGKIKYSQDICLDCGCAIPIELKQKLVFKIIQKRVYSQIQLAKRKIFELTGEKIGLKDIQKLKPKKFIETEQSDESDMEIS